jgi:hypothetical protein
LTGCFLPVSSLLASLRTIFLPIARTHRLQTHQNIDDDDHHHHHHHQVGAYSENHSSFEHGRNRKIPYPSKALNYSLPRDNHLAVISAHSRLATIQLLSEACHMPVKYSQCQYLLDVECGTSTLLTMDILIRFKSTQNTARKVAEHCASLYFFELAALQTIW